MGPQRGLLQGGWHAEPLDQQGDRRDEAAEERARHDRQGGYPERRQRHAGGRQGSAPRRGEHVTEERQEEEDAPGKELQQRERGERTRASERGDETRRHS